MKENIDIIEEFSFYIESINDETKSMNCSISDDDSVAYIEGMFYAIDTAKKELWIEHDKIALNLTELDYLLNDSENQLKNFEYNKDMYLYKYNKGKRDIYFRLRNNYKALFHYFYGDSNWVKYLLKIDNSSNCDFYIDSYIKKIIYLSM